jgi:predicted amidophosphoribosyltransferase
VYAGPARPFVAAWKERGLRRLCETAADLVAATVARPDVAVLTWVPGERSRTLWRGQNAAEALARALSLRWSLESRPLLVRAAGARQRGLSRSERRANVRGRFRARGAAPAAVGLVDDVYTTGATAAAAATELRRGGAGAVDVVTFARALKR